MTEDPKPVKKTLKDQLGAKSLTIKRTRSSLNQKENIFLYSLWRRLAPQLTLKTFLAKLQAYTRDFYFRVQMTTYDTRIISPQEAEDLPDNSADYETITYTYKGLEQVQQLKEQGHPIAFVAWHHGALIHAGYAITRVFPDTACFTRVTAQYGKVFSIPTKKSHGMNLVQMHGFLRKKRPIWYYLDSPPEGKTETLPILDCPCNISSAPIDIFRSIPDIQLIPVSMYYRKNKRMVMIFHPPPLSAERLRDLDNRTVLQTLFTRLEQDMKLRGPHQIRWRYLLKIQALSNGPRNEASQQ